MAGESSDSRELYETPTWAVAGVCAVMIIISLLLEHGLHHIGEWFKKKNKNALGEALEKVKTELMILGFISLLLVFFQEYIAKICIPESVGNTMLPCRLIKNDENPKRRLLSTEIMDFGSNRRSLAAASEFKCPVGKVPLMSTKSLHELHLFIFFLAVVHVVYSASVMALGRLKIRSWKQWEEETMSISYEFSTDPSRFRFTRDTSFVQNHASFGNRQMILVYIVSFFRQFIRSIRRTDYLTLRHGFINAHLNPGMKFNFQKYIKRSLDDDFKVVVGISPILWACGCIILLINVYIDSGGWNKIASYNRINGSRDTTEACSYSRNANCEVKRPPFLVWSAPFNSVSDSLYVIRELQSISFAATSHFPFMLSYLRWDRTLRGLFLMITHPRLSKDGAMQRSNDTKIGARIHHLSLQVQVQVLAKAQCHHHLTICTSTTL
ncbi:MLO-like protein 7 isoform X3 [Carex rostrata]